MLLQGVWTAGEGKLPPWKGDYHHGLNTVELLIIFESESYG